MLKMMVEDFNHEILNIQKTIVQNIDPANSVISLVQLKITKNTLNNAIKEFPNYLYKENKAKSTYIAYMNDMKHFYNFTKENFSSLRYVHEINNLVISEYKTHLVSSNKSGMISKSTMDRRYNALKVFFKYLKEYNYIAENILIHDKFGNKNENNFSPPKYLTEEELNKLNETIRNSKTQNKYRDLAMIAFLRYTGCRRSELLNLKWTDVNFYNETIILSRTKTNNANEIPMHDELKKALLKYKDTLGTNIQESVFISQVHKALSPTAFETMFKKYIKESGLPENTTPHHLRHTFITKLTKNNIDSTVIQKFSGHKDIRSLKPYMHLSNVDLKNALKYL